MPLTILCSGHLIRYPLGGFSWHHFQYLLGFSRLGHRVVYFENYGWDRSCYDPAREEMTDDPAYGLRSFDELLQAHAATIPYAYLSREGSAFGMSRVELAQVCAECDVYFNLSNINWIPELAACRRRVLIDTDPVFTQIRAHGLAEGFGGYSALFTYGENIGRPRCSMPAGGAKWRPTRQPVVLDCWMATVPPHQGPLTTVMNWSSYGEHEYQGRVFGQKDREFETYLDLPASVDATLSVAINAPDDVKRRLSRHGWDIVDPLSTTLRPADYQAFIARSRAEFSVAKHGYVVTHSGWFSDRSSGYLASGRPVILQDTGFSDFLPADEGLLAFRTPRDAQEAIKRVTDDPERHGKAARRLVEEFFDSARVLTDLLEAVL